MSKKHPTNDEIQAKADAITARILLGRQKASPQGGASGVAPVPLPTTDEFVDWETWWLPAAVQDWVEAQARACAVPRVIPLAAAVCAMATALQGKVDVEVKPGWREPLSVFWLVASPTGTMKSRVLDAAKRPLKAIEAAAAKDAADQAKRNRSTRNMLEGRCKKLRGMFASKGHLTEDQRNELSSYEANLEQLPNDKPAVWLFSNINPALIPKMMANNLEAEGYARMSVMADEDTFLRNMMGRHSGHADLEVVLSGYTGGAVELTRKSVVSDDAVQVRLDRAHLSMLVMTQPHVLDWMKTNPVLADQGFWGRTMVTCLPRGDMPPLDAPPVPDAVQTAYERLIATLHAMPGGQLIRVPEGAWGPDGALATLYADVRRQVGAGTGGEGYAVRAVGRVCRFWALSQLGQNATGELVNCRTVAGGVRAHHEGIDLLYLIQPLYYHVLREAQASQPASAPGSQVPARALRWLRQSSVASVGSEFSLRQVTQALRLSKATAEDALTALVEHGYIAPGATHRNRNGTTTLTYKVLSLHAPDESGATVSHLRAAPEPSGPSDDDLLEQIEHEDESPPGYYGADEFEGVEP